MELYPKGSCWGVSFPCQPFLKMEDVGKEEKKGGGQHSTCHLKGGGIEGKGGKSRMGGRCLLNSVEPENSNALKLEQSRASRISSFLIMFFILTTFWGSLHFPIFV